MTLKKKKKINQEGEAGGGTRIQSDVGGSEDRWAERWREG